MYILYHSAASARFDRIQNNLTKHYIVFLCSTRSHPNMFHKTFKPTEFETRNRD